MANYNKISLVSDIHYKSETEITKEQLKNMTSYYLENNSKLKCNDYAWLRKNAFAVVDILYKLKNKSAFELSEKIFKKYNKVISPKAITKHFKNIGITIPIGDRNRAVRRCGTYYRKKLDGFQKSYKHR